MTVLHKRLEELNKERKSYVVEGYPRTRVQALKLQELGIVPDKLFILNRDEAVSLVKLRTALQTSRTVDPTEERKSLNTEQVDAAAQTAMLEHSM